VAGRIQAATGPEGKAFSRKKAQKAQKEPEYFESLSSRSLCSFSPRWAWGLELVETAAIQSLKFMATKEDREHEKKMNERSVVPFPGFALFRGHSHIVNLIFVVF